jgi:DNA-binding transcriptional LysR family regulator
MDRWQAMRIVATIAETMSFAKAARHLNTSPPVVTRAVAALEATIGARLFIRTSRSVRLTEAGSRYVEECRRILTEIAEPRPRCCRPGSRRSARFGDTR